MKSKNSKDCLDTAIQELIELAKINDENTTTGVRNQRLRNYLIKKGYYVVDFGFERLLEPDYLIVSLQDRRKMPSYPEHSFGDDDAD